MNRFDQPWQKLTARARQARDERDLAVPLGFSTRVAALAFSTRSFAPWAAFERFALRGLLVATVLGVGAFAFNYSAGVTEPSDEYAAADTVGELLDLS